MLEFLNIAVPVAAIALAIWGAHPPDNWKNWRKYRWWLVLFGFVLAAATWWQVRLQDAKGSSESQELRQENEALKSGIDKLGRKNDKLQAEGHRS
jgi:hypothetical protein